MQSHFFKVNHQYYVGRQKQYSKKKRRNVCYDVYDEVNKLLPSLLIGENFVDDDYDDTHSKKYKKLVRELSNYFRYESQLFSDILSCMRKSDEIGFKGLMLSKCVNIANVNNYLKIMNVRLKKCHKISNIQWRDEVVPLMEPLVLFF